MVRVCTCSRKKRTLKHKSNKSGDQSFFYVQLSCSLPCSQLSHSGSEFDQYVEPDMDKAPRSEHERLCKHPGTKSCTLSLSHTHALIHDALVLLCLSLMYLLLHFVQKRARNTKTNNPHAAAPSHAALLLCSKNSIHLNNGEEEKCQH